MIPKHLTKTIKELKAVEKAVSVLGDDEVSEDLLDEGERLQIEFESYPAPVVRSALEFWDMLPKNAERRKPMSFGKNVDRWLEEGF